MHKALITHDNYFDLFGHYESTVDLTMSLYHCLRKVSYFKVLHVLPVQIQRSWLCEHECQAFALNCKRIMKGVQFGPVHFNRLSTSTGKKISVTKQPYTKLY